MLYVVEAHHHVLPVWQRLAHACGEAPFVLSLDHHADVLPAFSGSGEADWLSPVEAVTGRLRHDEHFDYAVKSGIISGASILVHDDFTEPADERIELLRDQGFPDVQTALNNAAEVRPYADMTLESARLEPFWKRYLDGRRLIVDIDLDVFLTARACEPADARFFLELVRHAEGVTVSRESDWVRLLRLPGENIDADSLLASLERLLRRGLSE